MDKATILIVEDNAIVAFALQRALTHLGYNIIEPVDSGEEAVEIATAQRPDLVLMDVTLAGNMDGITAAENIRTKALMPVIYLTGNPYDERLKQSPCISKPVAEKELALLIEQVLKEESNGK
jgi:CheY-like chemotaxis protein